MIRVVIADEQGLVRQGLRCIVEAATDMLVVGEAADGPAAERVIRMEQPDVALTNWELPDYCGLVLAQHLKQHGLAQRLLLLGTQTNLITIQALLTLDVGGFVTTDQTADKILAAIRGIANGETGWFSPLVLRQIGQLAREPIADLSEREAAVMYLVAQGLKNLAIAEQLGLSIGTVKNYITSSYSKLDVSTRAAAVAMFWRNGWITAAS